MLFMNLIAWFPWLHFVSDTVVASLVYLTALSFWLAHTFCHWISIWNHIQPPLKKMILSVMCEMGASDSMKIYSVLQLKQ